MDSIELRSPRGNDHVIHYRDDSSDLSTLGSTWNLWGNLNDEYGLRDLPNLTGTAIDIGAHIGSVALALLADHPDLRVIAVEPLAENCAVMEVSARENGWADRLTILNAGIAKGKTTDVAWNFEGDENLRNHRYIGGIGFGNTAKHDTTRVPAVRLGSLIEDTCPFLKIDCEGCEWVALADRKIGRVQRIVGEGHSADWLELVHKYLDKTHDITVLDDRGGPGTFSATRR